MTHKPHKETGIFINEVSSHQRRYHKVLELTHSTTKAAGVMLLAAIVALVVANTAAHGTFTEFWHTEVVVGFGANHAEMSLAHIINDVLMAVFFLLVGLEIKYEMTVGELTNIRQAILPVGAAIGGVLMPVGIYLLFNAGNPETMMGWGVPTATDIAFALGILALLGSRVPAGLRVFLSTLAVADDIVAILVIAIFYGQSPSFIWLAAAAVVLAVLIVLNRTHVYSLVPYLVVGAVLWYCIFMSGVHSTIAGVLLAFTIPSGSHVKLKDFASWSGQRVKEAEENFVPDQPVIGQADYLASVSRLARVSRQVVPPATRLERKLYPWVYFAILPLFALTNADVAFMQAPAGEILSSPIFLGVFFGLVAGKPLGIMLMSFIIVKAKLSALPENVNWAHMLGAALLGGVGFTMSIFVANLAFADASSVMIAKVAILAASLVAGVLGFAFLFFQAKAASARGQHFEMELPSASNMQSHAAHEAERRYKREHDHDENE
jgi:NhaA family Na+:H+ antiporter